MSYNEPMFIADLFRIGVDLHRRGEDTDAFQVETAATEVERLLKEVKRLRERVEQAEAYAAHVKAGLVAVVAWAASLDEANRASLVRRCRETRGDCFCGCHGCSTTIGAAGLDEPAASEGGGG